MEPTAGGQGRSKSNTRQEVFVCLSILIFSSLWLPLCIEKYPNGEAYTGLTILLFSFLSSITGCSLFLVAIFCDLKGYQKASPVFLVIAIIIALIGEFIFNHQYCSNFFSSNYSICFIAEFFSFFIYILTSYYLISMILSRTNFKIGISDLAKLKEWFGSRIRVKILLIVNISMLIVIYIDIQIYSYSLSMNGLNRFKQLDILWVIFCAILGVISIIITLILIKFQKCIPFLANKCLLILLMIITIITFCSGYMTAWKYKFSNLDGMAQIGNIFIWCVVNLWMLVEFMTKDINVIIYQNVAATDQEISETDHNDNSLL